MAKHSPMRPTFAERSLASMMCGVDHAAMAGGLSARSALLQSRDGRVKLLGFAALIVTTALARRIDAVALALMIAIALAAVARIPPVGLLRLWTGVGLFTAAVVLPSIFVTKGVVIARVGSVGITDAGCRSALLLVLRVLATTTFATILMMTTAWPRLIASLRLVGLPVSIVAIIDMSHRYIFLMLRTGADAFEARKSRSLGPLSAAEGRKIAAATAGVLLSKSLALADEVHNAMVSRGFRGDPVVLETFALQRADWLAAAGFAGLAFLVAWSGFR